MAGRVYIPFVAGLLLVGIGVLRLRSDGVGWSSGFFLGAGIDALALAIYYWRGSRARGS